MEAKIRQVLKESKDVVENKEPSNDISFKWVQKNEDLRSLEEGIPVMNFSEQAQKRNKEMEFRVYFFYFSNNINFIFIRL